MPTKPKTYRPAGVAPAGHRSVDQQREYFKAYDAQRGSSTKRGYDRNWRKARDLYMRRNPLCEFHLQQGQNVAGTLVDHITPLSQGGARLDFNNLQTLCDSCHRIKTLAES